MIRRKPTPRDAFRQLLERTKKLREERSGIYDRHRAEVAARIREYTGWKGDDLEIGAKAGDRLADWELAALRRPVADRLERRFAELKGEINWAETCLERLADQTRPIIGPDPKWLPYDAAVWASSYRSTGNGAHYARGSCEVKADLIRAFGVEARAVEVFGDEGKRSAGLERFRTEVLVHEELDVEILKRSLAYSLKDWLRFTMRRGMNPRVFSPFLPWGTEAKLGLDHFGRDLPAKATG